MHLEQIKHLTRTPTQPPPTTLHLFISPSLTESGSRDQSGGTDCGAGMIGVNLDLDLH